MAQPSPSEQMKAMKEQFTQQCKALQEAMKDQPKDNKLGMLAAAVPQLDGTIDGYIATFMQQRQRYLEMLSGPRPADAEGKKAFAKTLRKLNATLKGLKGVIQHCATVRNRCVGHHQAALNKVLGANYGKPSDYDNDPMNCFRSNNSLRLNLKDPSKDKCARKSRRKSRRKPRRKSRRSKPRRKKKRRKSRKPRTSRKPRKSRRRKSRRRRRR